MDEPIDWNDFPDGETAEEMRRARETREAEDARQAQLNRILWERFAGHFGANGEIVTPFRLY